MSGVANRCLPPRVLWAAGAAIGVIVNCTYDFDADFARSHAGSGGRAGASVDASVDSAVDCADSKCCGPVCTLASDQAQPWGLALSNPEFGGGDPSKASVFWTNAGDGTVMRLFLSGEQMPILLQDSQPTPTEIAVYGRSHGDRLYWRSAASPSDLLMMYVLGFGPCSIEHCGDSGVEAGLWTNIESVVAADDYILWTTDRSVWKAAYDLSEPQDLFAAPDAGSHKLTRGLSTFGSTVCWAEQGAQWMIWRMDLAKSSVKEIAAAASEPCRTVVDDNAVYWLEGCIGSGSLKKAALGADIAPAQLLAEGLNRPTAIALDEDTVYWTETGSVMAISKDGGVPRRVAPIDVDSVSHGIAVDDKAVYWTSASEGKVLRAPKDNSL